MQTYLVLRLLVVKNLLNLDSQTGTRPLLVDLNEPTLHSIQRHDEIEPRHDGKNIEISENVKYN